ncbi:hypothetical protein FRB96_006267 [Tulasnella sp. 330]|nr:hypothetical protein FRB96_006267 [Tulasnella sp. 330]KAG8885127.1 hypothetical protein FRB97_002293 [Tulasnella sp. 331]KAG8890587.1 hypothetical protein FRB98_007141 [Tulasnella sp. 332]
MPINFFPGNGGGRKRTQSESNPYRNMLNMENAYVPQPFFNSPRFVPLPLSPGPPAGFGQHPAFTQQQAAAGYQAAMGQAAAGAGLGAPGFNPYPWAQWPSPNMYPMDLQPPPQADTRATSIHVLLAPGNQMVQQPHVLYDVRYKREKAYMTAHPNAVKLPDEYADHPATQPPVPKMRLICRDIPWRITVANSKGISIGDVLEAIYKELHMPLTEGEWWIAQEEERERALAAYQDNCSEDVPEEMRRKLEEGVKRVDWLGKTTMLMAISRTHMDEPFIKARIPDKKAQAETWILDLGEI